jgi:glycosyltransferase involved in cell wall biosynthesis
MISVHGLCRALAALGHEVSVFTTNVDGDRDSAVPLETPVDMDGVRVHYFAPRSRMLPARLARRLYVSEGMSGALRQFANTFDVMHLHGVFLWPTWAGARTARRAGVPYVLSPRGMLVPELIRAKSRVAKMLWVTAIEKRNLLNAGLVHFTSHREKVDASRAALTIPRAVVVPNGIELRRRPAVERDPATLLVLGRINWKKRIDSVIDALPALPGVRLIIAGNDEESLTPRLREQAERLGVADRVEFHGPIFGDAKFELLARATIVVQMSISENFGNAVLEALMMATPVIVSPGVGLADDVAAAAAGVVTDDLVSAARSMLADPARRAEMGRKGRALVERSFTWPMVAEQMERAYQSVVKR